jgi:hypothetical protein
MHVSNTKSPSSVPDNSPISTTGPSNLTASTT